MVVGEQVLKKEARKAGLFYLIMSLAGAYGIMFVSTNVIVRGNAAATADNILSQELFFRTGILGLLICGVTSVYCFIAFHKLFKDIDKDQLKILGIFLIVQIPVYCILASLGITLVAILRGDVLTNLLAEQRENLASLLLKLHSTTILLLEGFWGLWLFPLARLIFKSGFIPFIIGMLITLAGAGYVIDSLCTILLPGFRTITQPLAFTFSAIGELSIILWLLIKGVRLKAKPHEIVQSR